MSAGGWRLAGWPWKHFPPVRAVGAHLQLILHQMVGTELVMPFELERG